MAAGATGGRVMRHVPSALWAGVVGAGFRLVPSALWAGSFFFWGCCMNFLVLVTYSSCCRGKVLGSKISLTSLLCFTFPLYWLGSGRESYRVFETLRGAQDFIAHTILIHQGSNPPPTVFDGFLPELF